jgi:hypothetical protein
MTAGMYEHHHQPLITRSRFLRRMALHVVVALALLGGSLGLGVAGFMTFDERSPLDGLLNAAMLLGGMGPVGDFSTDAGKLFGAAYALYAGLIFIVCAALLLTPVLHRLLHSLHLDAAK